MRKRILSAMMLSIMIAPPFFGAAPEKPTFGVHVLFGGRYDDVRMCVGSPSGVKGGPIGEVYFDVRFQAGEKSFLILNIPIFRPILFGASFKMLQFEPQMTYERLLGSEDGTQWVIGGGLGAVFHYGPDYQSDPDNRGDEFFAVGPLLSASVGLRFDGRSGSWTPGVKAFYAPLFSADYSAGTVLGGGLEAHYSR